MPARLPRATASGRWLPLDYTPQARQQAPRARPAAQHADRQARQPNDTRQQLEFIAGPIDELMIRAAIPKVVRILGIEGPNGLAEGKGTPLLLRAMERILHDPHCYRPKQVQKKQGRGWRRVDAPNEELKFVQRAVHDAILTPCYLPTRICHSFVGRRYEGGRELGFRHLIGRSIVSNAFAHLGVPPDEKPDAENDDLGWRIPRAIFAVDLKDAYPSISQDRVLQIFELLAEDQWTAQILACLTTWNGAIPQGAPTSPLILNLALRGLDLELNTEFGSGYHRITRYVDDITLSTTQRGVGPKTQERLVHLVESHGFRVNRAKDCYYRGHVPGSGHTLRVTGIDIAPEKRAVFLSRASIERFRFLLYHAVRVVREARIDIVNAANADDAAAGRMALGGIEERAVGRILGIVGFCAMVYGEEELPQRLSNWLPGEAKDLPLSDIVKAIRRTPPTEDIYNAIGEAGGY